MRKTIRKNLTADNYKDVHEAPSDTGSSDVIVEDILTANYGLNDDQLHKVLSINVPYSGAWLIELNVVSFYDYGVGDGTSIAGYVHMPGALGSQFYLEDHASNQGINYYVQAEVPALDTTPQIPEIAAADLTDTYDSSESFSYQIRPMLINAVDNAEVALYLCSETAGVPAAPNAGNGASRFVLKNSRLRAKLLTRIEGIF